MVAKNDAMKEVPIEYLRPGAVLAHPVFNDRIKLLEEGMVVTDSFLNGLRNNGVLSVKISDQDFQHCRRGSDGLSTEVTQEPVNRRVQHCLTCDQLLPIHPVTYPQPAPTWVCTKCFTTYVGCLSPEHFDSLGDHVQPVAMKLDKANLVGPQQEMAEFIRQLALEPYDGPERRTTPRYYVSFPVVVQPVDQEWCPVGEAAMMLTRNVSIAGICMLHTQPAPHKYLLVEFPETKGIVRKQVVLQVLRCTHLDPFYEIAGRLVMAAASD